MSARADAEKINQIFLKHWKAFKKELSGHKELQEVEDKRLAWSMFLASASRFLHDQIKGNNNEQI
jgi:hypothetical protein